eukprot:243811_1
MLSSISSNNDCFLFYNFYDENIHCFAVSCFLVCVSTVRRPIDWRYLRISDCHDAIPGRRCRFTTTTGEVNLRTHLYIHIEQESHLYIQQTYIDHINSNRTMKLKP